MTVPYHTTFCFTVLKLILIHAAMCETIGKEHKSIAVDCRYSLAKDGAGRGCVTALFVATIVLITGLL